MSDADDWDKDPVRDGAWPGMEYRNRTDPYEAYKDEKKSIDEICGAIPKGPNSITAEQIQKILSSSLTLPLVDYLKNYMKDDVFATRFAECIDMLKAKNSDYTEGKAAKDRIAHFRAAAEKHDVSMTKIWGIFVDKHWSAIQKYLKDGQTESEPISGRINDVINYLILLGAIIDDQKK